MLTIFTIPKPFTDPHIRVIQRNAIQSWKKLHPDIEILLLGNEAGTADAAREFGVRHIPDIAKNEYGTPFVNSAFETARRIASHDIIMYANTDIILLSNLIQTLPRLPAKDFLAIGRRINLDVDRELDFEDPEWKTKLKDEAANSGVLHSWAGIDYFIFNGDPFKDMPAFVVGRPAWDNWTVGKSRRTLRYTIDATACITAIHESHEYTQNLLGHKKHTNPEAVSNKRFIKDHVHTFTIEDANWRLTQDGLKRNYLYWLPFVKRYLKHLLKKISH